MKMEEIYCSLLFRNSILLISRRNSNFGMSSKIQSLKIALIFHHAQLRIYLVILLILELEDIRDTIEIRFLSNHPKEIK